MKLLMLLLLVSCANSPAIRSSGDLIKVGVNTTRLASTEARTIYITSPMKEVADDNLLFKSFSERIYNVLEAQGYTPVNSLSKADLVMELRYEVADPENYEATRNVPIYGGSSKSTVSDQFGRRLGTIRTTNHEPTGYTQVHDKFSIYSTKVGLQVFEISKRVKGDRMSGMIWATSMENHSTSQKSLESIFPHMIFIGSRFFGKELPDIQILTIDFNDARLRSPASN